MITYLHQSVSFSHFCAKGTGCHLVATFYHRIVTVAIHDCSNFKVANRPERVRGKRIRHSIFPCAAKLIARAGSASSAAAVKVALT